MLVGNTTAVKLHHRADNWRTIKTNDFQLQLFPILHSKKQYQPHFVEQQFVVFLCLFCSYLPLSYLHCKKEKGGKLRWPSKGCSGKVGKCAIIRCCETKMQFGNQCGNMISGEASDLILSTLVDTTVTLIWTWEKLLLLGKEN